MGTWARKFRVRRLEAKMRTECPQCYTVLMLEDRPAPGDQVICTRCGERFDVEAHIVVEYDWLYRSEEYVVEWQL